MEITRVKVRLVDMSKVRGLASITIDDEFVVHDLRVVDGDGGLFVAMPSRKIPNGTFRDVAHPINTATRQTIQEAVIEEYLRCTSASELAGEMASRAIDTKQEFAENTEF